MATLTFPAFGGYVFIQTGTTADIINQVTVDENTITVDHSAPTVDES